MWTPSEERNLPEGKACADCAQLPGCSDTLGVKGCATYCIVSCPSSFRPRKPSRRKRWQVMMWWHPRDWAWPLHVWLPPSDNWRAIYRWIIRVGPLEVRRWAKRKEPTDASTT